MIRLWMYISEKNWTTKKNDLNVRLLTQQTNLY